MSRPEEISNIELDNVEIATFEMEKFSTDGTILKAYGTFIESMQRAGHSVESQSYGRVRVYRAPDLREQVEQLKSKQVVWDERQKYYDQMVAVGHTEHSYQESSAKKHAEAEGLPWPPPHEPITSLDTVIRTIEDLAAAEA